MRYRFLLLDVFTQRPFGGNQLAVFPEASGLSAGQMQLIAREFNFSECVFVFPPQVEGRACRLRIFTPGSELPFAGHPTVGAAYALASAGYLRLEGEETRAVFEEGVGPLEIVFHAKAGALSLVEFYAARLPEFGPPPANALLARMLSLAENDLLSGADFPEAVSCGVPFLFVPLRSLEAVRRARLDRAIWQEHLASSPANQVYLFSYQTETPAAHIHARMFAPAMGIVEDPATGAAATALGGYLGKRSPVSDGKVGWVIEQGFEIGRPSLLHMQVEKRGGEIASVRVGGSSVVVGEGWLHLPEDSG